jgi:hypothetical protein
MQLLRDVGCPYGHSGTPKDTSPERKKTCHF